MNVHAMNLGKSKPVAPAPMSVRDDFADARRLASMARLAASRVVAKHHLTRAVLNWGAVLGSLASVSMALATAKDLWTVGVLWAAFPVCATLALNLATAFLFDEENEGAMIKDLAFAEEVLRSLAFMVEDGTLASGVAVKLLQAQSGRLVRINGKYGLGKAAPKASKPAARVAASNGDDPRRNTSMEGLIVHSRRHDRIVPTRKSCMVQVGGRGIGGAFTDVSRSGVGVKMPVSVKLGDVVTLRTVTPDPRRGGTLAKAVRVIPGGMAFEFLKELPERGFDADILL